MTGIFFFFLICLVFETGFLYSPDCHGTYYVDQAGLNSRARLASELRGYRHASLLPDGSLPVLMIVLPLCLGYLSGYPRYSWRCRGVARIDHCAMCLYLVCRVDSWGEVQIGTSL